MKSLLFRPLVMAALATGMLAHSARAAEPGDLSAQDKQLLAQTVSKAVAYLKTKGQAADGSYTKVAGIGPTALATTALLTHGATVDDPVVSKSLKYLTSFAQKDGGIYPEGSRYRNYETSLAIVCLSKANQDGRYTKLIKGADAFIKGLQWDENEGQEKSDAAYGGGGYGKHKRPDLSNTSFMIDALRAAGNDENSEAIQRALIFVSRCQNLESEHNTTPFAAKNPDGGFYYTPAAGGSSQAGETANGGLRSYASMTYAGLKSMIYAGLDAKDPRVKAALSWVQKHYDLRSNPGLGDAGLYYYYHLFAKALNATGMKLVTDESGKKHNWRAELIAELAGRQQEDGSWTNENSRWLESDPNLVTAFSLLALSYCE